MKHFAEFMILTFLLSLSAAPVQKEQLTDPRTGKPVRYAGDFLAQPYVCVPKNPVFQKKHFRGVWVATVENIDFPKVRSAEEFRQNYKRILRNLRSINATAVIFQVRPMNDAFYPSRFCPYSKYFSGTQGVGFGLFDPLEFMIEETHRMGMEFHAWLNPYRVAQNVTCSKKEALAQLSPVNFARQHPELVLDVPGNNGKRLLILDPGNPQTRYFFLSVVRELLQNYRVDAIHFDDYFYPYAGTGSADSASFAKYNPKQLSLDDWRRRNVTQMVTEVSRTIRAYNKKTKRHVQFGISPFGIWANKKTHVSGSFTGGSESYAKQYADTRAWVRAGLLDYIAPQLYWTFGHNTAAYAHLADWWAWTVHGTRTKLYIGHSIARLGDSREWSNSYEIYNQFRYNLMLPDISGSILYSYSKIFSPLNQTMQMGVARVKNAWLSVK